MIRILKSLGLALVAMAAMSAVVASASQASEYTCSAYECLATGSNTAGNETFTTPGGTVQCNSHYTVEKEGTTNATGITGPTTTVTVTPTYTGCKAFGFVNATVNMMGCDYVFHSGSLIVAGRYNNSVSIVCPAGSGPITITAGTCVVDVPAQGPLTNVETENLAGGTLTVKPNVTGITLNVTTDGFGCPFPGTGHFTGSFHGDVTLARVGGGSISVSGI